MTRRRNGKPKGEKIDTCIPILAVLKYSYHAQTKERENYTMSDETSKPLSQLEAGRVKTEIYNKHNKKVLYRELYGYTPKQIGARLGIRAQEVAEMAGRIMTEERN